MKTGELSGLTKGSEVITNQDERNSMASVMTNEVLSNEMLQRLLSQSAMMSGGGGGGYVGTAQARMGYQGYPFQVAEQKSVEVEKVHLFSEGALLFEESDSVRDQEELDSYSNNTNYQSTKW